MGATQSQFVKNSRGHVINIDDDGYRKYLLQRQRYKKYSSMESEIATLRKEVDQIKKLLNQTLNVSDNQ